MTEMKGIKDLLDRWAKEAQDKTSCKHMRTKEMDDYRVCLDCFRDISTPKPKDVY